VQQRRSKWKTTGTVTRSTAGKPPAERDWLTPMAALYRDFVQADFKASGGTPKRK